MVQNKVIDRQDQNANSIFNNRGLKHDYRTLYPLLKPGIRVLDIGCGTGAISKDIAEVIGSEGTVTGIDNTLNFIEQGSELFGNITKLSLVHADILNFQSDEKFDLIIAARVFQWITSIDQVLEKIKTLLKPGGKISILDYNHNEIVWIPSIPNSMQNFYETFLKWRSDAGMDNAIGNNIKNKLIQHGFTSIQQFTANEDYTRLQKEKLNIWSKVASSSQMVEEGYLTQEARIKALEEYGQWVNEKSERMTMVLWDTHANFQ